MNISEKFAELEALAARMRIKLVASHARERALEEELNEIREKQRDTAQGELQ